MAAAPEVLAFLFADAGDVPNNPRLPLLVYRCALPAGEPPVAESFERLYPRGRWRAAWRYGVYDFVHFHSTAHEVLGVYRGSARLRLGHTTGTELTVEPGDAIVIPAGVGHQNLGSTPDFHVVGGYPEGQEADLIRAGQGNRAAIRRQIASVPLPEGDPILGPDGPLMERWAAAKPRA